MRSETKPVTKPCVTKLLQAYSLPQNWDPLSSYYKIIKSSFMEKIELKQVLGPGV